MKFELTMDQVMEMVNCIVDCDLSCEEAEEYARGFVMECNGLQEEDDGQCHEIAKLA